MPLAAHCRRMAAPATAAAARRCRIVAGGRRPAGAAPACTRGCSRWPACRIEAVYSLAAIARTLWRVLLSKRRLLEWRPSADVSIRTQPGTPADLLRNARMWRSRPLLAIACAAGLAFVRPAALAVAAPVLLLWLLSPLLVWWFDRPLARRRAALTEAQVVFLRRLARRTWSFFELPSAPPTTTCRPTTCRSSRWRASPTAPRRPTWAWRCWPTWRRAISATSPRASCSSAADATPDDDGAHAALPRPLLQLVRHDDARAAAATLRLDGRQRQPRRAPAHAARRAAGHGRRAAAAGRAGSRACTTRSACWWRRSRRTLAATTRPRGTRWSGSAGCCWRAALVRPSRCATGTRCWTRSQPERVDLRRAPSSPRPDGAVAAPADTEARTLPPVSRRWSPPPAASSAAPAATSCVPSACDAPRSALASTGMPTLRQLAAGGEPSIRPSKPRASAARGDSSRSTSSPSVPRRWPNATTTSSTTRRATCWRSATTSTTGAATPATTTCSPRRRGWRSFVAIAHGQMPQEHWFALGRLLTTARRRAGAAVVERLDVRVPDAAAGDAELRGHAARRDLPRRRASARSSTAGSAACRGASPSRATTRPTPQLNYQYRAFGVPGLGLKRGLADDLVVAPYASVLALMVAPEAACENLQRLAAEGLPAPTACYEAIDYTPVAAAARPERAPSCARSWRTTRA